MATVVITDFKAGLDARNMPESTLPGALLRADNCVINQGGEIEKLQAWRRIFNLPECKTFGMQEIDDIIWVFGTEPKDPKLPQKVQYQQVTAPSGANMTGVIDTALFDGLIYLIATFDDGKIYHFYDGAHVDDFVDGSAVGKFTLDTGVSGEVSKVRVDGIDILFGSVAFNQSLDQTAKDVAERINAYTTEPNFRATSYKNEVIVSAEKRGSAGNGAELDAVGTEMIINVNQPIFADGADTPADKFEAGTYAYTGRTKMNVLAKSIHHFSDIDFPTVFIPQSGPAPPPNSAGFNNLANHSSGSESLKAMSEYFNRYAFFSRDTIQIWELDPNPELNNVNQIIRNTGTVAAGSVVPYGNDTVFLDRSGVRSLQGRDSSRSANINDIGTAIDPIIQDLIINDKINSQNSQATVDPLNGRYYLSIGLETYIFNFFPGNKVSGWTRSFPGFRVEVFGQRELKIIARSGDNIYQLGGAQGQDGTCAIFEYGIRGAEDGIGDDLNAQADIITPFFDASDPSRFKNLQGIDIVCEGKWEVYLLTDPRDLSKQTPIGKFENSSLKRGRIPMNAHTTHFALRFVSIGHEFARVSRILGHFKSGEQE